MIASTPSKLPRPKRTSHPSRVSPEVVVHLDLSQWRLCCGVACIIMLPCWSGQKGRSISTGRFPVDESALCDCSASSSSPVPPWSKKCAATDSRRSRIVRSFSPRCLPSGSHSVGGRSRFGAFFHGVLRLPLGNALPRTHWASKRFATLLCLVLRISFLSSPQSKLDVLWSSHGDQHQNFPAQCVEECRTSHVQHVVCETFPLSDRPLCSMSLRILGAGRFDGSSIDPAHGSVKYRSFVTTLEPRR